MNPIKLLERGGAGIILFYAVICFIVFLLQATPFPGVLLMILAGPFWIGILIHIMMAHLTFAAAIRSLDRGWLALPIIFYAACFAMHLKSERVAHLLAAEIEQANAAQSLKVEQPFSYRAANFETLHLLEMYRVDSAFADAGKQHGQQEYAKTYYAKGADCDAANRGYYSNRRFEPWAFRADLFYYVNDAGKTRQCLLQKSVLEANPVYEVKSSLDRDLPQSYLFKPYIIVWQARDLRADDAVSVRVGSIATLAALQVIMAGCALDSGTPAWRCGVSLDYGGDRVSVGVKKRTDRGNPFIPVRDPDTWDVTPLARALGLTPREPAD